MTPKEIARLCTRRQFISKTTSCAAAAMISPAWAAAGAAEPRRERPRSSKHRHRRKRIAILATEVRKFSHAQHFIDRFLEGYGWQGRHYRPAMDLAALYVDQFPEGDLSRDRSRRHDVTIYPTVAEALTCGTSNLAVDGVLIIAEHGKYPRNEKGQTRYPRYDFFKQTVRVFERSGRSVPVFNDKHLSTDWKECVEMVQDSRRLGFAFLAGSSLPVTWRIPSIEMPLHTALAESVCVCYGRVDSYDFHGYETAQCMSERRAGGEIGVSSVHAVRGEKVWKWLADRDQTRRLMMACLSRSHTIKVPEGYTVSPPKIDWMKNLCPNPVAVFMEHFDGFQTALFLFHGLVSDFTYAGRIKPSGKIISCQMHLPMPPHFTTLADFFNPLVSHIEETIERSVAVYPVERTLLTSGMTLNGVESLFRGQERVLTPEMKVEYQARASSTFWRA